MDPNGDSTLSPLIPSGAAHGRTVHRDATEVASFVERSAPRPGGCVLSARCSRTRSAHRGARSANGLTVARGVGLALSSPRPLWNRSVLIRGRARGHVGGPEGRPRSGCRPEAVPGPACPWAWCSRSAWWCVVGSRRSRDGAGRRVLGARSGWRGARGLPGRLSRNRAGRSQSFRILGAASRPGGPTPFASGGIAPHRTVHRDATDAGLVRRSVRSASRRLRPLAPMRSNPLRYRGARSVRALTGRGSSR